MSILSVDNKVSPKSCKGNTMDHEIEKLLFQQVEKPKNHLMTKIINLWDNRYRINIYIEIEENNLTKRKIYSSYFCHYNLGKLKIIPDADSVKIKY